MLTPEMPHHVRVELVVRLAVDVVAVAEPVALAARRVPRDVLRVVVRVEDRVEVLARVGGLRRHLGRATVRGTYQMPETGTRTHYVPYVGPWGQAALRLRYVPNAEGWYA